MHIGRDLELGNITRWNKKAKNENRRKEKKEQIRQAFINAPRVEVIPAKQAETPPGAKLRVAAYCRVSTYEEAQAGSFALQVHHYREMIAQNPAWELAGIYADEGVSATSMRNRVEFLRMLDDCRAGKIDLIMTKSVSRFARNTRDCLEVVRALKACDPPVGVLFETESLNTAETKSEFTLGVMSLVAQGESEQKSAAVTWSIIERFKKGIPIISTHNLLGFDKDAYGRIIIVEEEANIIRYIFNCHLDGTNAREIAQALTDARIPTAAGNPVWKREAVLRILHNEKYCGDVLMQKTFTVDCFTHKKMKNTGQRPQYRLQNGIPAIISREKWLSAQKMLVGAKPSPHARRPDAFMPVRREKTGALRGFIHIECGWKKRDIERVLQIFTKEKEKNDDGI